MARRSRSNKFNNKVVVTDEGVRFDSRIEHKQYKDLELLQAAGEIEGLERQVNITLQEPFTDATGKNWRAITYRADFCYTDKRTGKYYIQDAKGMETKEFNIKLKMLLNKFKDNPNVVVLIKH